MTFYTGTSKSSSTDV